MSSSRRQSQQHDDRSDELDDERLDGPRPDRLAELVSELTGTAPTAARHAIRSSPGTRDALQVVANAMISVDQPPPEGFRVTGFLRDLDDDSDAAEAHDQTL